MNRSRINRRVIPFDGAAKIPSAGKNGRMGAGDANVDVTLLRHAARVHDGIIPVLDHDVIDPVTPRDDRLARTAEEDVVLTADERDGIGAAVPDEGKPAIGSDDAVVTGRSDDVREGPVELERPAVAHERVLAIIRAKVEIDATIRFGEVERVRVAFG